MQAAKKKILVVDNNPVILKLMVEILQREGHDTWCAGDVFSCLDTLVEVTPDIIFVDLVMPRIGGDDLCRIIRNMDHLRHCYLVIVSGIAAEEQLDYRQLGVDAVIAKGPFNEMRRHVLKVVEGAMLPRKAGILPELKGVKISTAGR